jgi:hypothetical protein
MLASNPQATRQSSESSSERAMMSCGLEAARYTGLIRYEGARDEMGNTAPTTLYAGSISWS